MVIKLVRTDTTDSCKIQLSLGEHLIGRGKLLGCDDNRISRNHGQLEVSDASLKISACHQNPCFYLKKPSEDIQILKKDSTVTLNSGDRFGLLPDTFWYEVIYFSTLETTPSIETGNISENNTEEYPLETMDHDYNLHEDTNKASSSIDDNSPKSSSLISPTTLDEVQSKTQEDTTSDGVQSKTQEDTTSDEVQSKIQEDTTSDGVQSKTQEDTTSDGVQSKTQEDTTSDGVQSKTQEDGIMGDLSADEISNDKQGPQPQNTDNNECNEKERSNSKNEQKTPGKRSLSSEQDNDSKKIKTEPAEVKTGTPKVKTETTEVKKEPEDTKPGTSIDPAQQNAGGDNNQNIPKVPARERCMYGANCYRKNPVHLSQFSHPPDGDWGNGAQVPCPYGATCAKRDPRHRRDHSHPPGYTPPPHAPGVQVVQRHGNVYYINAHSVNFYEDHLQVLDSDGDSVDYDYEF